jgi:hypothetical protein
MFTHPANTRTARRSYGELGGWNFYPVVLPNGFSLNSAQVEAWRSRGAPLTSGGFPNNSVVVVQTYAPGLSNYDIVWVNGKDLGSNKLNVSMALPPFGLGSSSTATNLENTLEKYAKASFEERGLARQEAERLWASLGGSQSEPGTSNASDTSDAEVDAILAKTGGYDTSAAAPAAVEKPKTGYYTDGGGYAWYYNAEKDYMEAVAAPKGVFSTQPRFDASKSADKYAKMKGVLAADAFKGSDKSARNAAIANATSQGGVELPATAAGRPAPASAPPADVQARGEQKLEQKKQVKKGFRGAVSAVPTWAWATLGVLTLAGGGYYGYRLFKQHNA